MLKNRCSLGQILLEFRFYYNFKSRFKAIEAGLSGSAQYEE